jgi:uncharacterized protein YkwD
MMQRLRWRRVFLCLTLVALLIASAWSAPLVAWPIDQAQASTPEQPRLGPAPALTPDQIRALTTQSGVQAIAPRAVGQTRSDVVALFNTQYTPPLQVPSGWTGSVAGCVPGTTSAAFEAATIQEVNYYRTMAGLPSVTLDATKTPSEQSAALMMLAQNDLSHTPPPTWACYTADGAAAAGRSNLSLGAAGATAVQQYMIDNGVDNLGHRRWIIFPPELQMGTGSTDSTNALDVTSSFGPRPATPEFVSWPPAGFVPFQVVYPTWSLAFPNGDFTNATVTMTTNGTPVQVTVVQLPNGFGDNGIAWRPQGLTLNGGMADQTLTVTVANVATAGGPRTFTYDVTVIDPALTGPAPGSTATPTVTPTSPVAPAPTATPTAIPAGPCAPRPQPTIRTVSTGPGQIQTTITMTGAGNTLSSLRIGVPGRAVGNASVIVQGLAVTNGTTVTFPGGATQAVMTVTRQAPGAATVPFVLVDNCGDWATFVGMGTDVP